MDDAVLRVAYVVALDLPENLKAHAVQILKNAQSWAGACGDFELICNVSRRNWWRLRQADLAGFYGLKRTFPLRAFPLLEFEDSPHPALRHLFYRLAAWRCRLRRTDLVYTRSYAMAQFSLGLGLPTLVETHSPPERIPRGEAFLRSLDHPCLLGLVTISEVLAQKYRQAGVDPEKIVVAPDGVDLEQFRRSPSREEARLEAQWSSQRPLALYVGHLYDGRGIEDILVAARQLPEVDFLLVGGLADHVTRWQETCRAGGLDNVHLAGFQPNSRLPLYYAMADLLLMPYSPKCATAEWMSPLKMFEYMASRRPLIATRLPAIEQVLRHGENAWLVAADDGQDLARGIRHILQDEGLGRRLADCAAREVEAFSWDRRVEGLLRRVRAKRDRSAPR
ncbi:MAG: glycosyltransferase family 4 protein [Magnetococcales bacterium]|nr:glycosyltransferase family 4 protein [Magnetococcales bacterium]